MHLKTFQSLGVLQYAESGNEAICSCPFCGGDKLYINQNEGLFDCKNCMRSGNKYTFMQMTYDENYSLTNDSHYEELSSLRGLPPKAFKDAELAYDQVRKLWLIPVRNLDGSITNLPSWNPRTKEVLNTAGCKVSLGNVDRIGNCKKIWVTEGPWDCFSMEYFLSVNKVSDIAVVYVLGAGIFKDEDAHLLQEKEVSFFYDNDTPGRTGQERAIKKLRSLVRPKKVRKINWPEGTPDKFDIRDWVIKNLSRAPRALQELSNMLEDLPCHNPLEGFTGAPRTFKEVVEAFRRFIYLPEEARIALLLEFSVVFSNLVPGDPLWLMIVGPPGAGKTLLLQALSDTDFTHYESSLSPKLLVSGFKTNDGSDPSLLPRIIGKTLIIKEYTEILALPGAEQEHVFAVLRGAYDGRVERAYAHGVTRIYPEPGSEHKTCHFSILAGVTNAIHGDNRAALGERFLKYQMFPDEHDPIALIKSAVNSAIKQELPEFELRGPASAFIEYKTSRPIRVPTVPDWIQDRIIGLSQIVSTIRAVVPRKNGVLLYRPVAEVGTRLSKQFIKVAQMAAFTLDKQEVDEEVYHILKLLACHTCIGYHQDVILAIAKWYPEPVLREQVMKDASLGMGTCGRCLDDLFELGAIEYEELKEKAGRPAHLWKLSPQMESLFIQAHMLNRDIEVPNIPKEARIQVRRRGRENLNFLA